ncbi:MAG TPA: hypothetical protein VF060_10715 [Trebonia sp.]
MFAQVREFARPVVSGTHAREHDLKLLRGTCLVTLAAIAVQFSLGVILNLYVQVPSSDAHAGWLREIETAPAALTVHAVLGLLLLGGAAVVAIQAIALRHGALIAVATAGVAALIGAFAAGEEFVKNGSNGASLTMALLASVALVCYVIAQAIAAAVARRSARQP